MNTHINHEPVTARVRDPAGHLVAPDGKRIVGTSETITAVALIDAVYPVEDEIDGKTVAFTVDYNGETKIDWENQTTDTDDGERVFVDESGRAWKESELKWEAGP